jgi:hypothetical protein
MEPTEFIHYVLMIYSPTIILKIRYQVKMTKIYNYVISTSTKQAVKGTSRRKKGKIYLFVEERLHDRIRILGPP